jgi:hypothetical protein
MSLIIVLIALIFWWRCGITFHPSCKWLLCGVVGAPILIFCGFYLWGSLDPPRGGTEPWADESWGRLTLSALSILITESLILTAGAAVGLVFIVKRLSNKTAD